MKRITSLILLLILILLPAFAHAAGILRLGEGERAEVDLNGDGSQETVFYKMQPDDDGFDDMLQLFVRDAQGNSFHFPTEIIADTQLLIADPGSDGARVILISGDIMSSDFFTYALRFKEDGLKPLSWRDNSRTEPTDGFVETGYGYIKSVTSDGRVTLCGTQDVAGTYFMTRIFRLKGDRFDFDDDGSYIVDVDPQDPEAWEYDSLRLKRDLGGYKAGERLVLTATDRKTYIEVVSEAGVKDRLAIAPNDAEGWGCIIEGVAEGELFEEISYRD